MRSEEGDALVGGYLGRGRGKDAAKVIIDIAVLLLYKIQRAFDSSECDG